MPGLVPGIHDNTLYAGASPDQDFFRILLVSAGLGEGGELGLNQKFLNLGVSPPRIDTGFGS
jgi:hypothetical protein